MKEKTCIFIGNSKCHITTELLNKAKKTIIDLIVNENIDTFFCGGYGNFDNAMARLIFDLKAIYSIKSYYITPYICINAQEKLNNILKTKLFDNIIFPELEQVPYRFAISKRNEWMVKNSCFAITHITYTTGGAWTTQKYALGRVKVIEI